MLCVLAGLAAINYAKAFTISGTSAPVRSARGLRIVPDESAAEDAMGSSFSRFRVKA